MAPRVQYRRVNSYNTRSNQIRKVKTPGSRVIAQHLKKTSNPKRCADTGKVIRGIPCVYPYKLSALPKHKRTVSRAYGGVLCASAVRTRILRSFLLEEARIVKALAKVREAEIKKAAKAATAKAKKAKKGSKPTKAKVAKK